MSGEFDRLAANSFSAAWFNVGTNEARTNIDRYAPRLGRPRVVM